MLVDLNDRVVVSEVTFVEVVLFGEAVLVVVIIVVVLTGLFVVSVDVLVEILITGSVVVA